MPNENKTNELSKFHLDSSILNPFMGCVGMRRDFMFRTFDSRVIKLSDVAFPLNIYGNNEEHKSIPKKENSDQA